MSINLRTIISSIESSARRVNSSTPLSELKRLTTEASRIDKTISIYDSTGALPIDSAFVGILFPTSTGVLYSLDSANGSWQVVVGTPASDASNSFQGSNYGYNSGGQILGPGVYQNTIQKYSFTSDGNSTDIGDLTQITHTGAGQSSSTYGHASGGWAPGYTNVINKFPFSEDTNASDAGDLTVARSQVAGSSSSTYGYTTGGYTGPPGYVNIIDKYSFTTYSNATDVGDLDYNKYQHAGVTYTNISGYTVAGQLDMTSILKFSMVSDGNSSDVGTVSNGNRIGGGGTSSDTHGYLHGGNAPSDFPAYSNYIEKFPFASDGVTTDVGNMSSLNNNARGGSSSTDYGYIAGFRDPSGSAAIGNAIEKYSFASDGNSTDVGDLAVPNIQDTEPGSQY